MAAVKVQSPSAFASASATTIAVTLAATAAGNALIACISRRDGNAITGVADSSGAGTWSAVASVTSMNFLTCQTTIYVKPNIGAGITSVTVTFAAGNRDRGITVFEVSGLATTFAAITAPPTSTTKGDTQGSNPVLNALTAAGNVFVVGFLGADDPCTGGTGDSFLVATLNTSGPIFVTHGASYKIGGAGTYTPSWVNGGNPHYGGIVAGFNEAAAAGNPWYAPANRLVRSRRVTRRRRL